MDEEFQEADVLWPWPDTPPPSPEDEEAGSLMPAALPEMYEFDADAVEFSCEPFSGPPPASSSGSSLTTTSSSGDDSSADGFFLSGPSSAGSSGLGIDAAEEFLEADVLWPEPDAPDDDEAAGFWWRCRRRVEEAASAATNAAVAACGEREGWRRPLVVSSPIDIPMAARGAAARRRTSPLPAVLSARRRW